MLTIPIAAVGYLGYKTARDLVAGKPVDWYGFYTKSIGIVFLTYLLFQME